MNIEEMVNEAYAWREKARALDAQRKEATAEYDKLMAKALKAMQGAGVPRTGTEMATAAISKQIIPTEIQWDTVWEHIFDTRDTSLLKRSLNPGVFRELLQADPELALKLATPYEQVKLNLTKKRGA